DFPGDAADLQHVEGREGEADEQADAERVDALEPAPEPLHACRLPGRTAYTRTPASRVGHWRSKRLHARSRPRRRRRQRPRQRRRQRPGVLGYGARAMGLTYRDAGVDIDEGDALVERIKPHARRTMRPEILAGIGGFGGLFEAPKRYKEPVFV